MSGRENDAELEPTMETETLSSDDWKGLRCSKGKKPDSNAIALDGGVY